MASGPPGGPLYVRIEEVPGEQLDAAALLGLVEQRTADRAPVVMGTTTQVTLAGAGRIALPAITGESLGRTMSCWVVVPAPGYGRSLLVQFAAYAGGTRTTRDCATTMEHGSLRPVADSLRLE
jgi:hypothetical protein